MPGVWTPTPESDAHQLAHPHDDRHSLCLAVAILMPVVAVLVTGVRLACRQKLNARLSYDDFAIMVAVVGCLALSAVTIVGIHAGLGKHSIYQGLQAKIMLLKLQVVFELVYVCIFTSIKISILLFYRRVFPAEATTPRFQFLINLTMLLCFCWWLVITVVVVFECTPISYAWNQADVEKKGHCINWSGALFAGAATNVVIDIIMLTLPVSNVWRMQIRKEQKFAISGIFLLGGFVVIVSIVRCSSLMEIINPDAMYAVVNASLWSLGEITTAMVCANAPVMGPLLRNLFPNWIKVVARSLNPLPTSRFPQSGRTRKSQAKTFEHLESNDRTLVDSSSRQKTTQTTTMSNEPSPQSSSGEDDISPSHEKTMSPEMSELRLA